MRETVLERVLIPDMFLSDTTVNFLELYKQLISTLASILYVNNRFKVCFVTDYGVDWSVLAAFWDWDTPRKIEMLERACTFKIKHRSECFRSIVRQKRTTSLEHFKNRNNKIAFHVSFSQYSQGKTLLARTLRLLTQMTVVLFAVQHK